MTQPERLSNNLTGNTITGIIEVILEDKHGNIKRKESVINNMTQAALAQMLLAGLGSTNALNDLFWIHKSPQFGQFAKIAPSSPLQLYCMTDEVSINPRQIHRNYLKSSQFTMFQATPSDTSKVPFYTDALDDSYKLFPQPRNCAMVGNLPKFTFEYRTDPDVSVEGYIRGILIGLPPFDTNSFYGTPKPLGVRTTPRTPNLLFSNTALENPQYGIQHHMSRGTPHTVVWKSLTPNDPRVRTFDTTTGTLSTAPTTNFFFDTAKGIDFSGCFICPGDFEALTYTAVKVFLKGAEQLLPVPDTDYVTIVTVNHSGSGYGINDTFTLLEGKIDCTVTAVNPDGSIAGITASIVDPSENPLGDARTLSNCPAVTALPSTGLDATMDITVQRLPYQDALDWDNPAITNHYKPNELVFTLAWRNDITGQEAAPPPAVTFDISIPLPAAMPVGMRTTPVMVWHDGSGDERPRIEVFYSAGKDPITQMFNLYKITVDPFTLGGDPATNPPVISPPKYVGQLPFVIGHKSPRIDGQRFVQGFYDVNTREYYLPTAQRVSQDIFVDIGLPGMLLGIRIAPKIGTENSPPITAETIRNFEVFASDYNISDDDVACDRASDPGTYQYTYSREGVVQMSLYGAQPNKAVQYVNLDYVWSGATLNNPIEKEEDDLLRVIYSFLLGNR